MARFGAYNNRMAREKLNSDALNQALETLPGWSLDAGKLFREYKFADFSRAIGFMAAAAIHIEKLNHHPEWANVYNRVSVHLTTHDAGGITAKDLELASLLDSLNRT